MFVQAELSFVAQQKQNISILEICFDTGLNALMTLQFLQNNPTINVNYVALESFTLKYSQVSVLNYIENCNAHDLEEQFKQMHTTPANQNIKISSNMLPKKHKIELTEYNTLRKFDLIYFDAFAPEVQPAMWKQNIFKCLQKMFNNKAVLVTYSAKNNFKQMLKTLGFKMQKLKEPSSKHQMTCTIWHSPF